jgi:hypothetical protein
VVEYDHGVGRSVIGGYVVRGGIDHLDGVYLYGDLNGRVWSFRYWNGRPLGHREWTDQIGSSEPIYSFGQDSQGRVYLLSGSAVYRFVGN